MKQITQIKKKIEELFNIPNWGTHCYFDEVGLTIYFQYKGTLVPEQMQWLTTLNTKVDSIENTMFHIFVNLPYED